MKYQMAAKELHNIEEWADFQVKPSKFVVDSDAIEIADFLRNEGYIMVDRTIKATIPIKKDKVFSRLCRIPLERKDKLENRIFEIAKQAFLPDSRFFDRANTSEDEKREAICAFVDEMKSFYICRFKGEIAGFLEVVPDGERQDQAIIRLAAVDEKYRVAGVATALYAGAVEKCREQGIKKLWGRISSRNMAVMNLYASLGAAFSQPLDVYVRR